MNKMELEKQIIEEGKKRSIIVTGCIIHRYKDGLHFRITIKNETVKGWVYPYQVEELVDDIVPLEFFYKIDSIDIAPRSFKVGETVEVKDIFIKLDAGEKEPRIIKGSTYCGQWIRGWVKGKVVETPEQNGRVLAIKFARDIWYQRENILWNDIKELEQAIKSKKLKKIEKGQLLYCGTDIWDLRKCGQRRKK